MLFTKPLHLDMIYKHNLFTVAVIFFLIIHIQCSFNLYGLMCPCFECVQRSLTVDVDNWLQRFRITLFNSSEIMSHVNKKNISVYM